VHDEFLEILTKKFASYQVGWGKESPKAVGALIDVKTRDKLLALVQKSVQQGAKLVYGGSVPSLPDELKDGAFLIPTILDNVTDDMEIAREEIFGPVCPVLTFTDLNDVIARSNSTRYGLCSYLYSHDSRVIEKCIEDLDFGRVVVNAANIIGPNIVHTGHKQSGVGVLYGRWSMEEYYNLKMVCVKP
jgi:succinate-semialdehyde dehydrogenase/glutarate-semialdehyde dehydrogenase